MASRSCCGAHALLLNRIHGLRYASLRYFNVAGAPEGPDGIVRGEAHEPESHLIPLVLDVALAAAPPSASMGRTTRRRTEPACATTSTCRPGGRASAALGALETKDRLIFNLGNARIQCARVIESARRSPGMRFPRKFIPDGQAIPRFWSPVQRRRSSNWLAARYTKLDEIIRTAWVWHQKRYRIQGNRI